MRDDIPVKLTAQSLAYGFLSKVFYDAPTLSFMQALVSEVLFADWPLVSDVPEMREGLDLLRTYCDGWDDSQFSALQRDYTELFIGPEHLLAPPWESVYRSPEHLLFEQSTLDVRHAYAQFGLQAPRLNAEPDDHIGLELAFFAHLCALGVTAVQTGDSDQLQTILQAQRRFLHDHLLQWAPEFWKQVQQGARTAYYRGAALLGAGCLSESTTMIESIQSAIYGLAEDRSGH